MAVSEQTPYIEYTANGVTTSFAMGFECEESNHLVVTVNDLDTNVGDWFLDEQNIVFKYAPLADSIIKIWRSSPLERSTTFKTYDNSFTATSLNIDLDKIWLVMQELNVKNSISDGKLQSLLDSLIEGNINGLPSEILARISGDQFSKNLINIEANRAYQSEIALSVDIENQAQIAKQNNLQEKERAQLAELGLQSQINVIGVGNKAYKTFAEMNADKANIPAKSKITVTNDPTESNNGDWQWDGAVFTKSEYDPITQSKNYTDAKVEFWQVDNIQIQQFGPFSRYAAGFIGDNGKMPFGIEKDGTAVMDNLRTNNVSAEVLSVNDFQMPSFNAQPLDPISGYSWGVVGANNKMPLGIGNDGTIHAERIKVGSIDVKNANTFMYEKASQEWWIHPVHTYTEKPYPRVVSGAYGEDGSIIVGEYVIGQGITKNIIVGQTALIDDHNAPSVFIKENRRSVVMWQNHDKTQYLSAKVSTKDGDISTLEFADEQQIVAGVNISYTQLHHIESESTETEDIFYIFSRFAQTAWGFTKISVNQETGIITTLDQHNILTADAQYYMTSTLADNKLRIASYYNPAQALNQIHYWEIDIATGDLSNHLGTTIANVKTHANLPINIANIAPVLAHNASIDRRMFYVRSLPMSPAILYLEWTAGQLQNTGNYKVISLESDGSWKIRTYAASGKPFYSNYFDGASFPNPCLKDEIIVCRYDNVANQGVLERVINDNETMIAIESARVDAEHLIRPISPQNGGNLCAYVQLHAYATTSTFSFESDVNFIFLK